MAFSPRVSPRLAGPVSPPCSDAGGVPSMPALPPESLLFFKGSDATANAWVDRLQGLSVPASGTPIVAADAAFGGRVVAQSANVGNYGWRGTGLSGLPASGTNPYTLSYVRFRAFTASGNQTVLGLRSAALAFGAWVRYNGATSALECSAPDNDVAVAAASPYSSTAPVVLELWSSGTHALSRVNGVSATIANAGSLGANQTTLAFGMADNGTNRADVSHAVHWMCSSKPSDAAITVVTTWLAAYYG